MFWKQILSVVACGLLIGLGGCAAAPLAQVAVTRMASPAATCANPSGCAPALEELANAVDESVHRVTEAVSH